MLPRAMSTFDDKSVNFGQLWVSGVQLKFAQYYYVEINCMRSLHWDCGRE